jgi:hypothetical protein
MDCNDDTYETTNSEITAHLLARENYPIRVSGFDEDTGTFELELTAGECSDRSASDLNGDCKVDMKDFAIFASEWMTCHIIPAENCN